MKNRSLSVALGLTLATSAFAAIPAAAQQRGRSPVLDAVPTDIKHHAVAGNGTHILHVFTRPDPNTGGVDLWAQLNDARGAALGNLTRIAAAAADEDDVAVTATGSSFFVTFTRYYSPLDRDVFGVFVDVSNRDLIVGTEVTIDDASTDHVQPRVALGSGSTTTVQVFYRSAADGSTRVKTYESVITGGRRAPVPAASLD